MALVSSLAVQTLVGLGRQPDPIEGVPRPDFAQAQYCIDLLGILEDKTRGNLTEDEARMLATTLHELRLMFVEATMAAADSRREPHVS